ncbi:interferon-inducible GTPase 5-like [Paramuricea clavata]|uniref:Interferon-inducible GTPase 5-like n=1 Tax=Paramuricea clavata TaxID=317549 RepID=A0A7D9DY03_PARCT|nr:interferon-inducible GTPase 5-like [Paramuricea clavata]
MFAGDTQIATSSDDIKVITETLNRDLNNVANWLSANKLTLNSSKTEYMIIGSKKRLSQVTADPAISVGNLEIKRVEMTRSLGLMIDELADDDKNAAKTGVTETTMVPTFFVHPTNKNIRFWDLPGIGTTNFPDFPTFCEKVHIQNYDTFLIICAGRFTVNDLMLAKKVKSMSKSFFFIRTKIDQSIAGEQKKRNFDEDKVLKAIRDDCAKQLEGLNKGKIFLVSSWDRALWDFGRLEKAILDQLPSKQKESLAFSLRSKSRDVLKETIKILKGMCDKFFEFMAHR